MTMNDKATNSSLNLVLLPSLILTYEKPISPNAPGNPGLLQQIWRQTRFTVILRATGIAHSNFSEAHSVFEFGCGTGRFANELLSGPLPSDAIYFGCDISQTMVGLTENRILTFADRAKGYLTDGTFEFKFLNEKFDRVVSNYVLDIFSFNNIALFLDKAHRILNRHGLLCLVSLTFGKTVFSRLVPSIWTLIHRLKPKLVGGCRPIRLTEFIDQNYWQVEYSKIVNAWGISSEILVAKKA